MAMFSSAWNPSTPWFARFFGWGWPLFFGMSTGLLIYLTILPFPHHPSTRYLSANACALLRDAGFTISSRPSACLLHGAYRDGTTTGFISVRQGDVKIQIRLSEVMAIRRESL